MVLKVNGTCDSIITSVIEQMCAWPISGCSYRVQCTYTPVFWKDQRPSREGATTPMTLSHEYATSRYTRVKITYKPRRTCSFQKIKFNKHQHSYVNYVKLSNGFKRLKVPFRQDYYGITHVINKLIFYATTCFDHRSSSGYKKTT